MRSSSIAMGRTHVRNLTQDQHDALVSIVTISYYNYFRRERLAGALNGLCIASYSSDKDDYCFLFIYV